MSLPWGILIYLDILTMGQMTTASICYLPQGWVVIGLKSQVPFQFYNLSFGMEEHLPLLTQQDPTILHFILFHSRC